MLRPGGPNANIGMVVLSAKNTNNTDDNSKGSLTNQTLEFRGSDPSSILRCVNQFSGIKATGGEARDGLGHAAGSERLGDAQQTLLVTKKRKVHDIPCWRIDLRTLC